MCNIQNSRLSPEDFCLVLHDLLSNKTAWQLGSMGIKCVMRKKQTNKVRFILILYLGVFALHIKHQTSLLRGNIIRIVDIICFPFMIKDQCLVLVPDSPNIWWKPKRFHHQVGINVVKWKRHKFAFWDISVSKWQAWYLMGLVFVFIVLANSQYLSIFNNFLLVSANFLASC